jgi:hypothetical protein
VGQHVGRAVQHVPFVDVGAVGETCGKGGEAYQRRQHEHRDPRQTSASPSRTVRGIGV